VSSTLHQSAWRWPVVAWVTLAVAGALCHGADAPNGEDSAPATTAAESATAPSSEPAPSRLLSLMPDAWLPPKPVQAKPGEKAAPAVPPAVAAEPELTIDSDALRTSPSGVELGEDVRDATIQPEPKPNPWHGEFGVGMGTGDYRETWLTVERQFLSDRITLGFGAATGSYPGWWDSPRAWRDECR